jgi:hypothetical protein
MNYKSIGLIPLIIAFSTLPASAQDTKPYTQLFTLDGVTFDVSATNSGSQNKLTVAVRGLKHEIAPIVRDIDGTVTGAEIADLDRNQSPEIYVYVTSAGSGSYGSLVAYSANNRKSLTDIHLPDINDDKKLSAGYMGHDEFSVIESVLARRFPVYKPGDTNSKPTGGIRQVAYKLVPGEAGWVLKVKRVDNF